MLQKMTPKNPDRFLGHSLRVASLIFLIAASPQIHAQPSKLAAQYQAQVVQRLEPPPEEVVHYGALVKDMLQGAVGDVATPQYVVLVDRNPLVQALFVFWLAAGEAPVLIGASPVSTGRVGQFDHFETPLGVFDHTVANPDFRAEGTKNKLGFRGYGVKGMRVYDLGWQQARRGWGKGGDSAMRLQMHSTDPVLAESKLGTVQSKGCIRIPSSLNHFIDTTGLLDAGYENANAAGPPLWVLRADRQPVLQAGRYLIVVDTLRATKPAWSLPPAALAPAVVD